MSWLSVIANFWFYLLTWLDWWNGTNLHREKGYLEIRYRYRFQGYVIHVPYSLTQVQQEVVIKDHTFPLPYQNGIKFLIDPNALGWDAVRDHFFDD